MRFLLLAISSLSLAGWASGQAAFEAASVKPASPSATAIECSGGPGTSSPGTWRCSNVPLSFLIFRAYEFEAYQFAPNNRCCLARFDFAAKVPAGTTKEQFQQMIRNLLVERFRLALHHEQKEMAIFELSVGEKGSRMKESAAGAVREEEDPWDVPAVSMGRDGYPEFPAGRAGLQGFNGHYRWTGFGLSLPEIVKTLSFHLGRPVIDATGLKGKYDINLTWTIDLAAVLEMSGHRDEIAGLPESGPPGPNLMRAVQDQLGLKLTSKKGMGDVVVIDHLEKTPVEN